MAVFWAGSGGAARQGVVVPSGRAESGDGAMCPHMSTHENAENTRGDWSEWLSAGPKAGCADISGISKRRFMAHGGEMPEHEKSPSNWHFGLYLRG